jgi:tRNA(Arg) A34 adenosine deaminase TadA
MDSDAMMPSPQHERFLSRAVELSRHGMRLDHGGPFGAVVVRGDEIVGEGWNRVLVDRDPTAHAEVVAIRDACKRLDQYHLTGCEIYCSCEPCPLCLGAIYWARIERIWYAGTAGDAAALGFGDSFFYEQLAFPSEQRFVPQVRIPSEEAQRVMDEFAADPTKVRY